MLHFFILYYVCLGWLLMIGDLFIVCHTFIWTTCVLHSLKFYLMATKDQFQSMALCCKYFLLFWHWHCNSLTLYYWTLCIFRFLRSFTMHKKLFFIQQARYSIRKHRLWRTNVSEPWSGFSFFVIMTGMVPSVMQSWMISRLSFYVFQSPSVLCDLLIWSYGYFLESP